MGAEQKLEETLGASVRPNNFYSDPEGSEEGQWLLHELTEDFDTDKRWDKATRDHVWKYVRMQTAAELSCSLDSERSANLRKHGLVRLARTKG